MSRPRLIPAALAAVVLATVLGGCAGQDDVEATPLPTASEGTTAPEPSDEAPEESSAPPAPEAVIIDITVSGDDVSPNGESVEVGAGETVQLQIQADAPGELHVHSTPEETIAYAAGRSTHELTIDRPGVVEVESHDTGKVIVQLEVR